MFSKIINTILTLSIGALFLLGVPADAMASPSCFSSWEDLKLALVPDDDTMMLDATTFVICPQTTLNANTGKITIRGGDFVSVQCGAEGLVSDNCIIQGGNRHFDIIGNGAWLRGLTFRGAQAGAVRIKTNIPGPAQPQDTVLEQCIFDGNDSSDDTSLGAAVNVHSGGVVRFQDCTFRNNVAFEGSVDVDGGDAVFESCVFENNIATGDGNGLGGAAVYVYGKDGKVTIQNSCFFQNEGQAVVFLRSNGPTIEANDNNYGENNTGACQGIFQDANGTCQPFDGDYCGPTMPSLMPSYIPSSLPSSAPTGSPSAEPSQTPSAFPSGRPTESSAPTDYPSLAPSDFPSKLPSYEPSKIPSSTPSANPTSLLSTKPSATPSLRPTSSPSMLPSAFIQIVSSEPPTPNTMTNTPTNHGNSTTDSGTASFITLKAKGFVCSLTLFLVSILIL